MYNFMIKFTGGIMGDERDFNERRREILSEAAPPADRPRAAAATGHQQSDFSALDHRRRDDDRPHTGNRINDVLPQTFNNGSRRRRLTAQEQLELEEQREKAAKELAEQQEKEAMAAFLKKKAVNGVLVAQVAKKGLTEDTFAPVKAKFVKRAKEGHAP